MRRYLIILSLFYTFSLQAALVVEDGSLPVQGWVHSMISQRSVKYPGVSNIDLLKAHFKAEGLKLKTLEVNYFGSEWFQDHLLFNRRGELLKMADIEYDILSDHPPSFSTFYSIEDMDTYYPQWVDEIGAGLSMPVKGFKHTRVEGGELISGMKDNKPYAIVKENVVWRTAKQFKKTFGQAKALVAKDFEIEPQHLYVILEMDHETPVHIDTFMMALPNGKVIIENNALYLKAASELVTAGFKLVPVTGIFDRVVNFFIGFVAKSPKDGELVVFTNKSDQSRLNNDWKAFLKAQGVSRVYFDGLSGFGGSTGLDCAGVLF